MTCLYCTFESTSALRPLSCLALLNIATEMADVESFEEMVGTREVAAVATESGGTVATESGGTVATESGGTVATESGGAGTTGDETVATVGDEAAATGWIMYMDEGPYTIDVRHVEAMVGSTREAADGDRIRRGRDGDETGGPRDETHGHVMQHITKILFTNRFSQFLLQKNSAKSRL